MVYPQVGHNQFHVNFGNWKMVKKYGVGVEFDEFASIINNGIWNNNKLVDNKKYYILNI